jgi:hypothetical protein
VQRQFLFSGDFKVPTPAEDADRQTVQPVPVTVQGMSGPGSMSTGFVAAIAIAFGLAGLGLYALFAKHRNETDDFEDDIDDVDDVEDDGDKEDE